jgi:ribosomal protein S18 acetylase RimI-like enzyme
MSPPLPATVVALPAMRRLDRRDVPEVERHLLALGPADRRKRFLWPAHDDAIAGYVARIDPDRAVLMGAVDGDGRLVGLAEAHPSSDPPRAVEMAVSVLPCHRRQGVGRGLAAQAVALAFARGAEAAVFLFAPENRASAGLVRSLGARCTALGRALLVEATLLDGAGPTVAAAALEALDMAA